MTVNATAAYIQANSHPADSFRRVIKALRAIQGVVAPGDMAVTQNGTPNMSVNVAAGNAVVDGTQNTTTQGAYHCLNDATVNLAIAASDPTNPRIDIVCISIQDAAYAGGANQALLQVVTGTPAGSPSPPATPANSIVLAQVAVAANAVTIVNANITDKRTFVWQQIQLGVTGLTVLSSGGNNSLVLSDAGIATLRNALQIPPAAGGTLPSTNYGTVPVLLDTWAGGATNITFPTGGGSIPSGFRTLEIRWRGRTNSANNIDNLQIQCNSDTGAHYAIQQRDTTGTNVTAISATGATAAVIGVLAGGLTGAAFENSGVLQFDNYTSTSFRKNGFSRCFRNDATAFSIREVGWQWQPTSDAAITSVNVAASAGTISGFFELFGYP